MILVALATEETDPTASNNHFMRQQYFHAEITIVHDEQEDSRSLRMSEVLLRSSHGIKR